MYHRWAALALVLALCAVPTKQAAGQDSKPQPRERKLGVLGQNYPNPFNPETTIPITIDSCPELGGQVVVTLRVYNILAQPVAVPVLDGPGKPVENLTIACGATYLARWDGKVRNTGQEAASGVYFSHVTINGKAQGAKKMLVAK